MSASSEIRFKIGADTSALSRGFVHAQSLAAQASSAIAKKFQFKDTLRGFATGIGIGSVEQIARTVVAPFESAKEKARELSEFTSELYAGTVRTIGAIGGPVRELELKKRQLRDMSDDIEKQRKLVDELNASPIRFISEDHRTLIKEAESDLRGLIKKQAELANEVHVTTVQQNRQVEAGARQIDLEEKLTEVELRDGGAREKAQLRLNALQKEYRALKKQGASQVTLGENFRQQMAIRNEMKIQDKQGREERDRTLVGLGSQLAGTHPDRNKSRPRGRSEMERIADRGARFARDAEEAARTGKSPGFIANLTARSVQDFRSVGERLGTATSKVSRDDSAALASHLISANETLRRIDQKLTPIHYK